MKGIFDSLHSRVDMMHDMALEPGCSSRQAATHLKLTTQAYALIRNFEYLLSKQECEKSHGYIKSYIRGLLATNDQKIS